MLAGNGIYTLLLLGWLRSSKEKDSTDPMWQKYLHLSPYNYYAHNPVMLVDLDGRNPVYDLDGNFMGTDDRGLQGEYIIMKRKDFTQGIKPQNLFTEKNLAATAINPFTAATVYALGAVDMVLLDRNQKKTAQIVNNSAACYDWNTGGSKWRDRFIRTNNFLTDINP